MTQFSEINVEVRTWKLREEREVLGSKSSYSLYRSEQFHSTRGVSQRAKTLSKLRHRHVRTRWLRKAVVKSRAHFGSTNKYAECLSKYWNYYTSPTVKSAILYYIQLTNKQAYKQTVSDFNTVRYRREHPALFHAAYFIELFDARKNREIESFPFKYW